MPAVEGQTEAVPDIAPGVAGVLFTVTAAMKSCPLTTFAHPTEVMVIVVEPVFANALVVKVPVSVPPLKTIDADWAVAVFAPLKL